MCETPARHRRDVPGRYPTRDLLPLRIAAVDVAKLYVDVFCRQRNVKVTSLNAVTNPVTIGLARRQIIAIVEDLSFTGEEGSPLEPHLEHYVRIVTVAWLSNHDPANDADRTDRWALLPLAHICHHRHAV